MAVWLSWYIAILSMHVTSSWALGSIPPNRLFFTLITTQYSMIKSWLQNPEELLEDSLWSMTPQGLLRDSSRTPWKIGTPQALLRTAPSSVLEHSLRSPQGVLDILAGSPWAVLEQSSDSLWVVLKQSSDSSDSPQGLPRDSSDFSRTP